jgi:hypothetical protein
MNVPAFLEEHADQCFISNRFRFFVSTGEEKGRFAWTVFYQNLGASSCTAKLVFEVPGTPLYHSVQITAAAGESGVNKSFWQPPARFLGRLENFLVYATVVRADEKQESATVARGRRVWPEPKRLELLLQGPIAAMFAGVLVMRRDPILEVQIPPELQGAEETKPADDLAPAWFQILFLLLLLAVAALAIVAVVLPGLLGS